MMRWILALCALLYVTMIFVGRDHGQQRWGLMASKEAAQPQAAVAPVPAAVPAPAPAEPAPAGLAATAEAGAGEVQSSAAGRLAITPQDLLKPGESLGALMTVTARGAVVREGPGIQYKLVGRLPQGTPAQEVVSQNRLVGWIVIQFDDEKGVRKQGYVASRLLSKVKN